LRKRVLIKFIRKRWVDSINNKRGPQIKGFKRERGGLWKERAAVST
jgi:hypothetical protein